jgi:YHS domain-containing protein
MGAAIRLLLILFVIALVVRSLWRFLEGIVEGASGPGGRSGRVPQKGARMVRDPVCGTFVVQSRALAADRGGQTAWFCSENCRRQWQAR